MQRAVLGAERQHTHGLSLPFFIDGPDVKAARAPRANPQATTRKGKRITNGTASDGELRTRRRQPHEGSLAETRDDSLKTLRERPRVEHATVDEQRGWLPVFCAKCSHMPRNRDVALERQAKRDDGRTGANRLGVFRDVREKSVDEQRGGPRATEKLRAAAAQHHGHGLRRIGRKDTLLRVPARHRELRKARCGEPLLAHHSRFAEVSEREIHVVAPEQEMPTNGHARQSKALRFATHPNQ